MEGVLKHTKLKDAELKEFISQEFADRLHIENSFCTNLEGQVVTIADEIAQRGHDIDDAITSGLIVFSKEGKDCCNFLEKLINKRVIANSDVTRFDHNAGMVIKKLFENYYKNPRLLHAGTLRKIYIDTLTSKVDGVAESAIDLLNGNIDISRQEIKEITTTLIEDINVAEQAILLEKRKILVRNIADYIAGMTDSYALNEYEKLR